MCKKESLAKRAVEARASARFAMVASRDGKRRVRSVLLPGHDNKARLVVLYRKRGAIAASCHAVIPGADGQPMGFLGCPGMRWHGPCYTTMAAVIVAAKDKGMTVSFCATEPDAKRLARLGGQPIKIWSRQARRHTSPLWCVVKNGKEGE
jgi:hypothetical protein